MSKTTLLKYRLERFSNILVFEVLEQHPSQISGEGDDYFEFESELIVYSSGKVEISPQGICLVGDRKNRTAHSLSLDYSDEAIELEAKIHKSLKEWAEAGGFPGRELKPKTDPEPEQFRVFTLEV